jgi:xylulokinase
LSHLLGIDIGTSSVKAAIITSEDLRCIAEASHEYPIHQPQPGYAEQNPDDWWQATVLTSRSAIQQAGIESDAVQAIGLSGQMHGTVCLDQNHQPLRPAIIWADTRSRAEVSDLTSRKNDPVFVNQTPGPPAAGFMGASLMWLSKNEPESLEKTKVVLLPKDHVRFQMTGEIGTDFSDAAATWLFDTAKLEWSNTLLEACQIPAQILPPVAPSHQIAGKLRQEAATEMGLPAGVPVVMGCADQSAQALGHGITAPGATLVTIGTGGQVFQVLDAPRSDPTWRFHVFNHAVAGRWYAQGAILAAGLSLRWLRDLLGLSGQADAYAHLSALASQVGAGAAGLIFLPYLAGERTPHMDARASGGFIGLRLHHGPAHLARAVMEGVTFALKQSLTLIGNLNNTGSTIIASGGAVASPIWLQIQADIYRQPVSVMPQAPYACTGAAILAGLGSGAYASIDEACKRLPGVEKTVTPNPEHMAVYKVYQEIFEELYARLKDDMHRLGV